MSRKAKGFKYVPGHSVEMKSLDDTLSSRSSDSVLFGDRSRVDVDSNSSSLDARLQHQHHQFPGHASLNSSGSSGSGERMMFKRETSRRGSGGGMPGINWSQEKFSVYQLMENCSSRFPFIVKVAQGYYGDERLRLNVGQVLQVYGSCQEQRVRVTESTGRQFSFPSSHLSSMEVQCSTHCTRSASKTTVGTNAGYQKLSDVLRESSLPITVAVMKSNVKNSSRSREEDEDASKRNELTVSSIPFGTQLTVQSVYNSTFLLANIIENGWLNSSSIVMIADDLRPLFRVALGLKGGTVDEWKDFSGMFDRAARHIKFSTITGYNDVIYDEWSEFSFTCAGEIDDDAAPVMTFERYFINKGDSTQSESHVDPNQQNRVFPKTSPHLSNYHRASTSCSILPDSAVSATATVSSGVSCYHSMSSVDSAGLMMVDSLSSRSLSGISNSGFLSPENSANSPTTTPLLSEETYVNVDELHPGQTKAPIPKTRKTRGDANKTHSGKRPSALENPGNVTISMEEINAEIIAVESGVSSRKSKTTTGDNKGTLISIDEGYSTKDSSRSNAKTDAIVVTSTKTRYSPVFF